MYLHALRARRRAGALVLCHARLLRLLATAATTEGGAVAAGRVSHAYHRGVVRRHAGPH